MPRHERQEAGYSCLRRDPESFASAAESDADVILFELEDAVPPGEKANARKNSLKPLNDIDWGNKTLSMRINGLDTPYMYRALVDVLEGPSERLDLLLIPKAGTAADVYAVDMLVTQTGQAKRGEKRVGCEIMIETAQGMANTEEIAGASSSNESLHLGENDYAVSTEMEMRTVGGVRVDRRSGIRTDCPLR